MSGIAAALLILTIAGFYSIMHLFAESGHDNE